MKVGPGRICLIVRSVRPGDFDRIKPRGILTLVSDMAKYQSFGTLAD